MVVQDGGFKALGTTIDAVGRKTEPAVERIDRRHFLVRLGGSAALITVFGIVVGELVDARRREALMTAQSEPVLWDARGFYQFAQLDPGSYTVRFEARGFTTAVRKSVSVVAPGSTNLNVTLTVGDTGGGGVEIKKE